MDMMYPFIRMNGSISHTPGLAGSKPRRASASRSVDPSRIFDRLSVLSDSVRCRALAVLESDELTVTELCGVLQLPQSTMSRHLKTLSEQGWVAARKDGTARRYMASTLDADSAASRLWAVVRAELAATQVADEDRHRLKLVLEERHRASQAYFSTAASEWSEIRRSLFGEHFDRMALLGLLDRSWVVGDLGAGTGETTLQLAPFVDTVIAVDESDAMLDTARERLVGLENVEVREGRLEALPVTDGELDAATLVLVLHHLGDPLAAIAEAGRALADGGRILIVDMLPHDRQEYRQSMGHMWLGFSPEQMETWLVASGFESPTIIRLPAATQARGPALFAATASKLTD